MSGSLRLQWSDALSTGNRSIDVQHKYLIDIINELADAIEKGTATQKVKTILNLLHHYVEWHFDREETCMERLRCPALCPNKAAHNEFRDMLKAFTAECAENQATDGTALRIYNALTNWFVNHIQKIDAQLGACTPEDQRS